MNGKNVSTAITPNNALVRMMAGVLVSWLLVAILVFAGAGRLDWDWLAVCRAMGLLKLVFILLLRFHDPELMVERVSATKIRNRMSVRSYRCILCCLLAPS